MKAKATRFLTLTSCILLFGLKDAKADSATADANVNHPTQSQMFGAKGGPTVFIFPFVSADSSHSATYTNSSTVDITIDLSVTFTLQHASSGTPSSLLLKDYGVDPTTITAMNSVSYSDTLTRGDYFGLGTFATEATTQVSAPAIATKTSTSTVDWYVMPEGDVPPEGIGLARARPFSICWITKTTLKKSAKTKTFASRIAL